eukprot:TRINITY_DN3463_c0_g2_i1.p1 TRINITY_DN3463_c0_g2~~TRINITY_DN3463_c0_g2_i1.p1  ORF type:complete len:373 (-),score=176.56 TRINITY_DN3463_c0_g2_i1:97-1215(-)
MAVNVSENKVLNQFIATLILSGVGDAIGFKNASWEFCKDGEVIHKEFEEKFGGQVSHINIANWRVSDDQVMHLATAKALKLALSQTFNFEIVEQNKEIIKQLKLSYIQCFDRMPGRAAGVRTSRSIGFLKYHPNECLPFCATAGGCGGSMRAMCIGLCFFGEEKRSQLIEISIESGRLTHNHPTAFFGALCSATFAAFAIENIPIVQWGWRLVDLILPQAYRFIRSNKDYCEEYNKYMEHFEHKFVAYLELRQIRSHDCQVAVFPSIFGVKERDQFYTSISYDGWGGASGDDSVIIAYDSLLGCEGSWEELIKRAALHGGDSDSTAAIAASWFGTVYTLESVPQSNYAALEFLEEAIDYANNLYNLIFNKQN